MRHHFYHHLSHLGIFLLALACCCLTACKEEAKTKKAVDQFEIDVLLPTTPVKDQGKSDLCWIYAMLATIETEHIAQGDSINLSVDHLLRAFLKEQSTQLFFARQSLGKQPIQDITTRGMMPMTLELMSQYGLNNYEAYHRKEIVDIRTLQRQLSQRAKGGGVLTDFNKDTDKLLDAELGPQIKTVFMYGAQYTPLEFAHSVCREDEYTAMTSYTHHPFGERFALEVPDNRFHSHFLNVPIDTLMHRIVKNIQTGHPVCWEGDISEQGFNFYEGVAKLPKGAKATQEERQRTFENRQTTDDHCMEIIGLAHNRMGERFFIMKNSWGKYNRFKGMMMVSYDYVKLKTIAVMMHL